jgi:GGDEF domain-containing protein
VEDGLIQQEISKNTVAAIHTLLDALHARIPLRLWMVSAVENGVWSAVYQLDSGYHVKGPDAGHWHRWMCDLMLAPGDAADSTSTPQLVATVKESAMTFETFAGHVLSIKVFVGIPLYDDAGNAIGALWGVDPEPDVIGIRAADAMVRQTAALVSRLLAMEIQVASQRRLAMNWSDVEHRDGLTGLLNQRGWEVVVANTPAPGQREMAAVIVVDVLRPPGESATADAVARDDRMQRIGNVLMQSVRGQDVLARLTGERFGILVHCDGAATVNAIVNRIREDLVRADAVAALSFATTPPEPSLQIAFDRATSATREVNRLAKTVGSDV